MALELAAEALLTALLALLAWRYRALSKRGIVAALAIAVAMMASGTKLLLLMVMFFSTSSTLTKLKYEEKGRKGEGEREGGRSAAQVLCSGGVPAALALLSAALPHLSHPLKRAAVACIAYSNADTWASEIGVLSREEPFLVTNPRVRVPAGVSGGITLLGEVGAVSGSAAIAVASLLLGLLSPSECALTLVLGWVGELLDAVLGALAQAKYVCTKCGVLCDREVHSCGAPARRVGGVSFLRNEVVNLATELAVSALSLAL